MKLLWTSQAWEDYLFWQAGDADMLARINELLRDIRRQPFTGLGKPEPLKGSLAGWWSRRIDREHRIVYRVSGKDDGKQVEIAQCRFHY